MSARTRVVATLVAGAACVAPAAAPAASPDPTVRAAARYVERAQNADGGFGDVRSAPSSPLFSAWAAMGLRAAGRRADARAARYLRSTITPRSILGDVERTIIGLHAAGARPPAALTERVLAARRANGSVGGLVNLTSFAIFALRATGRPARDRTVAAAGRFVAGAQHADGGFSFAGRGGASGTDDTAAALQALVASGRGRSDARVRRATTFLVRAQNPDGGFALARGASNAQSTAFAVQALVAAGRDPDRLRRDGSRTPLGYLRSLQGDDGSIRYSRTSRQTPVWVTSQALLALAKRPFPLTTR